MGSETKPKSHLKSQTKKSQIQNSQKFTMETIFDRFPHLSDDIFEYLDEENLANCVEVDRKWQTTIVNEKVYLKKKIEKRSKKSERFSKEWSMTLVKMPLKLLRRLAEYMIYCHYDYECYNQRSSIEADDFGCKCFESAPIHVAARRGDIELFQHIKVKTKNMSPKNWVEKTPLHYAAYEGHLEICKWYMKNTKGVNDTYNNGGTALQLAAINDQVEIFKCLLENGGDLYSKNKFGQTMLHSAAESGCMKICKTIVEMPDGIEMMNTIDIYGRTPIFEAVEKGELEIVKFLFNSGACLNFRDNQGNTPLHNAAIHGDLAQDDHLQHSAELVKFILANVIYRNPANENGDTPLHEAAKKGFLEICKLICQHVNHTNPENDLGQTPIFNAVEVGKLETVKFLFEIGGDLNLRTHNGNTPLHAAAMNGHTEVVEFILANVVDKSPVNKNGDTPLHKAAKNGYFEVFKLIFQYLKDGDDCLEQFFGLVKTMDALKDANEMNYVY